MQSGSPHYPPYSPTNPNYSQYHSRDPYHNASQPYQQSQPYPSSPRRPNLGSPLAPITTTVPHYATGQHSNYHQSLTSSPPFSSQAPFQSNQPNTTMPAPYEGTPASHAHPSSRSDSIHSPTRDHRPMTNGSSRDAAPTETRPQSQGKSDRASNPMSLASIIGPSNNEPSPPRNIEARTAPSMSHPPLTDTLPHVKYEQQPLSQPFAAIPVVNGHSLQSMAEKSYGKNEPFAEPKPRYKLTPAEKEKFATSLAQIEEASFSDEDALGYYDFKAEYLKKSRKRVRDVDASEAKKRRKRRAVLIDSLLVPISAHVIEAEERYKLLFGPAAAREISERDLHDEKERKKDMQRKRRREQQIRNEEQRLMDLQQRQLDAEDPEEAQKYSKQIQKSREKLVRTTELLEGGGPGQDDIDVLPLAPNLEGGTTSSFHLGSEEPNDLPPRKKLKGANGTGNRLKKSKEKKQAEKDAAEQAYLNGWHQDNHSSSVPLAPKEDYRPLALTKSGKRAKVDGVNHIINYDSKGYNQLVEQIVRDMARKDVPKVYRIKQQSLSTRQENMRKTVILASKQARKWQERTNKSMKDTQARAKRVMREMMAFWKRNEREERDMRKMAERKEIEEAKKAEADREANRQRRKLNFLISQTELYSHFIGKRIKTDEIERATDDPEVATSTAKITDGDPNAHTIDLPPSVADLTGATKVTNFDELDFDAEDETALQQAALANAQSAMKEQQDRARAFNGEDQMAEMDNSDMNFMNPTMAGDVQVSQPKMLQAQLKEYQLKGLNWLVNLYEQGINGILADEMGLGKTVQSISVMGYLAEQHNVWGPFLVIAPSSTLHNWQQEITRFVPAIKVLPYWGNAKDRKILRKFWDRKHITYSKDSEFHVLVTSYQLVVQDAQYFQKIKWQYMILDEAQAIKSSQSSRWKVLLGFNCRNRLLLTGTPIQNNMQELWALLHFIMPTLFDSHDEFSEWFSKDIESHAQSNTKLNQDQLKRLHMILKPFMLRRVKAHVQKELGDKVEKDVFCDLTYRQRAYYANLRSKISIMDLIEKATLGQDEDTATLMNLVMQFRKVCNHPDLFERADTSSPFSMSYFAETASFLREGSFVQVAYSIRNLIQYDLPRMLCNDVGRLDIPGPNNTRAGFMSSYLGHMMNVFNADNIQQSSGNGAAFSFLRFVDMSASEASEASKKPVFDRAVKLSTENRRPLRIYKDDEDTEEQPPVHAMLNIVENSPRRALADLDPNSNLARLCNISSKALVDDGYSTIEPAARPLVSAPPIEISALDQSSLTERQQTMFNTEIRNALFKLDLPTEEMLLAKDIEPSSYPPNALLPPPSSEKGRYTHISVPSMRRFVTDSGKLAKLDELLRQLKAEGHRVLLYFQMTRMIDLMEEYLTYRNYKYCRLDGSTKLEDRRDTVHDFQTRPEIFIFLLSTRAGGLGINLTSADTVIFYDSDWNPTIDSQAMDRAHRLGQTKQVTVYRLITRGTIEERIRKRAMQKEEVQRVVITGGDGSGVDFNTRDRRENRTKDIAMWLADDDQAALIEQKEKEIASKPEDESSKKKLSKKAQAAAAAASRKKQLNLDDMYHEGEGNFEDASAKASGAATPVSVAEVPSKTKKGPRGGSGKSKKAKTAAQRLAIVDAAGDLGMGGGS